MQNVVFVTGNQSKADYLAKVLDMPIAHHKLDLDELQTEDSFELVEHKVRQAYDLIKVPVLVEDVSLEYDALGGLPGPFIKFFVQKENGLDMLCRIADGFINRKATAKCLFGYFDGTELVFFEGKISGYIAKEPKGKNGFGWDAIFCPEGYDGKTRAELLDEQYDELYKTIRPVEKLRAFFTKKREKKMPEQTAASSKSKRVFRTISGGLILLVGIIAIPYPGPGWLIVFAGLAILAKDYPWAERVLLYAKRRYDNWQGWIKRQNTLIKSLVYLLTCVIVVITLWLINCYGLIDSWLGLGQGWAHSPLFR